MFRSLSIPIAAAAVLAAGASTGQAATGHGFSSRVTNPWFPLKPGSVRHYEGTKDGKRATETFRVLRRTIRIQGARCRVVSDRLFLNGKLAERTLDYYAQDRRGNVWYVGEDTATIRPDGSVESREGTFRAGRDGARAGIYITGRPRIGQSRRQEIYPGQAEDWFTVWSVGRRTVRTVEFTPLEPDVLDLKVYRRGVGVVLEDQLAGAGPRERLRLVSSSGL